ncbi:hypothetical protein D3C85_1309000 [compost metagenome]
MQLVAEFGADLQQADQVLGVGHFVAVADLQRGGKAARLLGPQPCRPCVQAVGVVHLPAEAEAQVAGGGLRRGRCHRAVVQRADQRVGVGGGEQLAQSRLVLQQAGQAAQQRDVLVGLRGDGDHQMHALARIPLHAIRHLQDGDAGFVDQVTVFDHAVRNGDAMTQKSIGNGFAAQQAVDVGSADAAGLGQ